MTQTQARAFIALDEWLGIGLLFLIYTYQRECFWYFACIWAVCIYVISYPLYWYEYYFCSAHATLDPKNDRSNCGGNRDSRSNVVLFKGRREAESDEQA